MILQWFLSKTVRQATAMRKHVQKLINHQRDILAPQAIEAVQTAMETCRKAVAEGADKPALEKQMENLEKAANKWLKPYPSAAWRENVEVLLVALAVAMGIRTFFLQPFKIPTGSMQPTLYGVTSVPDFTRVDFWKSDRAEILSELDQQLKLRNAITFPTGWERVKQWFEGVSYVHVVAQTDGKIDQIGPMHRFLILNLRQSIWIGGVEHTIWFPPDFGEQPLRSEEHTSELQSLR